MGASARAGAPATLSSCNDVASPVMFVVGGDVSDGLMEPDGVVGDLATGRRSWEATHVDLSTGAQSPVPVGTVGVCSPSTTHNEPTPFRPANGRPVHDYVGQSATFPCDPSGHPVRVQKSGAVLRRHHDRRDCGLERGERGRGRAR